jgi:DNA-directed RNA polymerase specialized sigma24 family protein
MDTLSLDALREQLYNENHRYIRFIAENMLNDKSLAGAVVDLTFITAFHCIRDLQNDPSPGAWLKNTAMTIITRCNKNLPMEEVTPDE